MKKKVPEECKNCIRLWTGGVKDSKHNMWCSAYGGHPSWKILGHCKSRNYEMRKLKDS